MRKKVVETGIAKTKFRQKNMQQSYQNCEKLLVGGTRQMCRWRQWSHRDEDEQESLSNRGLKWDKQLDYEDHEEEEQEEEEDEDEEQEEEEDEVEDKEEEEYGQMEVPSAPFQHELLPQQQPTYDDDGDDNALMYLMSLKKRVNMSWQFEKCAPPSSESNPLAAKFFQIMVNAVGFLLPGKFVSVNYECLGLKFIARDTPVRGKWAVASVFLQQGDNVQYTLSAVGVPGERHQVLQAVPRIAFSTLLMEVLCNLMCARLV